MVDSGIAANRLGLDACSRRPETSLGPLLEGFAAMEIARQVTWSEQRAEVYRYHTKDTSKSTSPWRTVAGTWSAAKSRPDPLSEQRTSAGCAISRPAWAMTCLSA